MNFLLLFIDSFSCIVSRDLFFFFKPGYLEIYIVLHISIRGNVKGRKCFNRSNTTKLRGTPSVKKQDPPILFPSNRVQLFPSLIVPNKTSALSPPSTSPCPAINTNADHPHHPSYLLPMPLSTSIFPNFSPFYLL